MTVDLRKVRIKLGDDETRAWVVAPCPSQVRKLVSEMYGAGGGIANMESLWAGELLGGLHDQS